MKQLIPILILFTSNSLSTVNQLRQHDNKRKFKVTISHLIQPTGYWLDYLITQDSLTLNYNCDLVNCKDTIIYKLKLDPVKADNYFTFIKSLHTDTLQQVYEKGGFDGLSTFVSIEGDSIISRSILTIRFQHPIIKKIVENTNTLIEDDKFRFKRY